MTALYRYLPAHGQARLIGDHAVLSQSQLMASATQLAGWLADRDIRVLALYADNCPQWLIVDLACQMAGCILLPLPHFFSARQIAHSLQQAGCCHWLVDQPAALTAKIGAPQHAAIEPVTGFTLGYRPLPEAGSAIPPGTGKITFTSGSTGHPKGVCLSNHSQLQVGRSLLDTLDAYQGDHLCLLPLSTLLENIAGAYRALLGGFTLHLPSAATLGFNGTAANITRLCACISDYRPATLILVPELLRLLLSACRQGWQPPDSLRFVAVGGASVATESIAQAHDYGMPVYEGYGLSECCSVVSLNTPDRHRPGSTGTVLPHQQAHESNGSIMVSGQCFLGYLGQPDSWHGRTVDSGDLGWLDSDGFLHISGRQKNLLISSFGRNIHPEWPETALLACPLIRQAVVFGDRQPFCCALLYADPAATDEAIRTAIATINRQLPDYARIRRWHRLDQPMTEGQGLFTANGRPRRQAIADHFASLLAALFSDNTNDEVSNDDFFSAIATTNP